MKPKRSEASGVDIRMRTPAHLLLGALTALALLAPVSAQGFQVGFADQLFGGPDGGRWAQRAVGAGADAMRVNVYWNIVATAEPERPRDAGDPAYDWEPIDRAVRSAEAAGLEVLMTVLSAPPWAEGPSRPGPEEAPDGTWRPDPVAYADFAHAIATRYSGFYPDPDGSGSLPEVDTWSAWNEPNISQYLTPQYVNGRNASAGIYVRLLNAFGGAVEAVDDDVIRVARGERHGHGGASGSLVARGIGGGIGDGIDTPRHMISRAFGSQGKTPVVGAELGILNVPIGQRLARCYGL